MYFLSRLLILFYIYEKKPLIRMGKCTIIEANVKNNYEENNERELIRKKTADDIFRC